MLLVARETVESLGNDNIEHAALGFIEQLLIAGTEMGCAAHGAVVIGVQVRPAFALDALTAEDGDTVCFCLVSDASRKLKRARPIDLGELTNLSAARKQSKESSE